MPSTEIAALRRLIDESVNLILHHQTLVAHNHLTSDESPKDPAVSELFRGYFHHRHLLATTLFYIYAPATQSSAPLLNRSIESVLADTPGVRLNLRQVTTLGLSLFMALFQPVNLNTLIHACMDAMGGQSLPNLKATLALLKTMMEAIDGGAVVEVWARVLEQSFVDDKLISPLQDHHESIGKLMAEIEGQIQHGTIILPERKPTGIPPPGYD